MREMSASDASRNFSAVLDWAEHGETIVVTRSGRRVALITPAARTNGGALREVLNRWQNAQALDEQFAAQIASAREASSGELDVDAWRG
ncbi:MAG TPA: type II toxin-antitoxin system prevent-host-death family antitoxin [Solirubrobacteraceae bacterium]|jgi:prevent-host-death family protein|nr:type II toxin-antitoxin system prevent-host-death family antitoxin [Solirubrobacteraceae bacterium]